jgi:hypothetical protein
MPFIRLVNDVYLNTASVDLICVHSAPPEGPVNFIFAGRNLTFPGSQIAFWRILEQERFICVKEHLFDAYTYFVNLSTICYIENIHEIDDGWTSFDAGTDEDDWASGGLRRWLYCGPASDVQDMLQQPPLREHMAVMHAAMQRQLDDLHTAIMYTPGGSGYDEAAASFAERQTALL